MTTAAAVRCPECVRGDRSAASAGSRVQARLGADALPATAAILAATILVFLIEVAQAGSILRTSTPPGS